MIKLKYMLGLKRIEKIGTVEIRTRAGVANISETTRKERLRWLWTCGEKEHGRWRRVEDQNRGVYNTT